MLFGPTRYGFFCLSFDLLLFYCVLLLCLPLIFTRSLLLYVGMPVPLLLDIFCYGWLPVLRKAPKRGGWISSGRALLDRVCLSLESGFASVYSGPSGCSVEVHQQEWVGVRTLLPLAASSSVLMTSGRNWPPMLNSQGQL